MSTVEDKSPCTLMVLSSFAYRKIEKCRSVSVLWWWSTRYTNKQKIHSINIYLLDVCASVWVLVRFAGIVYEDVVLYPDILFLRILHSLHDGDIFVNNLYDIHVNLITSVIHYACWCRCGSPIVVVGVVCMLFMLYVDEYCSWLLYVPLCCCYLWRCSMSVIVVIYVAAHCCYCDGLSLATLCSCCSFCWCCVHYCHY